ncbi:MAG: hypothetical protein JWN70_7232 [Planctomycetaceae bacterium]|nr:hypothetical protein [Planctomycetaceae bacterium]
MSNAFARMSRLTRVWALVLFCVASIAVAQDAPASKGSDAREKVRQQYKSDYAKLDTPASKDKLARKLIGLANKSQKDPVKRDALLDEAVDLGTSAGSIVVVLAVADARHTAGSPEIYAYKQEIFKKLGATQLDNKQRVDLADRIAYAISQAVHDAQFSSAQNLAELAIELCGMLPATIRDARKPAIETDLRQIEALVKLSEQVAEAQVTLQVTPSDEPANQLVGSYLGFVLGDWTAGRAHLQRGGGELARLAGLDATSPKDGKALMKMGDDWYALAAESETVYRMGLFVQAAAAYRQAEELVAGADRERATKLLAAIGKEPPGILGKLAVPDMTGAPVVASITAAAPEVAAGKESKTKKNGVAKKPVFIKKVKQPLITILDADYGGVNLTQRMQAAANGGLLVVCVDKSMAEVEQDGVLSLRWQIGNDVKEQTYKDKEIVFIDGRKLPLNKIKGLEILEIFYGTGIWGEQTMLDARQTLFIKLQQNPNNLQARNLMAALGDPVFGVPKFLIIRYVVNGKEFVKKFGEGQIVQLTAP